MSLALTNILMLKSISIFSQLDEDVLREVAEILDEVHCRAGATLFQKGDPGTSMYIIFEGSVRVHDGQRVLNHLGPGDVVGEMAALDPQPRSASITAVEDTVLFRLEREPFRRLMGDRVEVAWKVVEILCRHLRDRIRDASDDYVYMQQFARVTAAAAAVEAGVYELESLGEVARRSDSLGQLARLFERMVREVYFREERLKRQVQQLRIEIDEVKRARQVAEITETDYFAQLRLKAQEFRARPAVQ
jgi:CRP/FNR family cyclic AMP-dependent transcriptional regulator